MSATEYNSTKLIEYAIKNREFLQKSAKVYEEINLLKLKTIKEREDEYVRRMNGEIHIKMKGPHVNFVEDSNSDELPVSPISRISFCSRFSKKGASDV
jgi:hypothetical protein